MKNETIVQLQVEAYNERNIDKFCSFFHDDIQAIDFGTNEILVNGMEEFRKRYVIRFEQSPNISCTITARITIGNLVIDREYIEGFMGEGTNEAVVTYELIDKKIKRFWIMK